MELHQIRYFLALSDLLNFTAAAAACNVSQPALSRAISRLEDELGGALFRRERKLTHLTDFGRAVLPALRDCYAANVSAKELARDFHKEGHAPLRIALSRTFEIEPLSRLMIELERAFPKIEIELFRGTAREITERLRNGEAEIAVAGQLTEEWDRIESRKLYEQNFGLLIHRDHRLASARLIELRQLAEERLLGRIDCQVTRALREMLASSGANRLLGYEVGGLDDIRALVGANLGVGVWPVGSGPLPDLLVSYIDGYPMSRWIQIYTVFGRQRSSAAQTMIKLLRANDWSALAPKALRHLEAVA
jgi:DNA-binding transcriptional LysR family regulator